MLAGIETGSARAETRSSNQRLKDAMLVIVALIDTGPQQGWPAREHDTPQAPGDAP